MRAIGYILLELALYGLMLVCVAVFGAGVYYGLRLILGVSGWGIVGGLAIALLCLWLGTAGLMWLSGAASACRERARPT